MILQARHGEVAGVEQVLAAIGTAGEGGAGQARRAAHHDLVAAAAGSDAGLPGHALVVVVDGRIVGAGRHAAAAIAERRDAQAHAGARALVLLAVIAAVLRAGEVEVAAHVCDDRLAVGLRAVQRGVVAAGEAQGFPGVDLGERVGRTVAGGLALRFGRCQLQREAVLLPAQRKAHAHAAAAAVVAAALGGRVLARQQVDVVGRGEADVAASLHLGALQQEVSVGGNAARVGRAAAGGGDGDVASGVDGAAFLGLRGIGAVRGLAAAAHAHRDLDQLGAAVGGGRRAQQRS